MADAFENLMGETCVKNPGSLSGGPFSLTGLESCTVTILDYTSFVNVSNCSNCKILIGPTHSVSFTGCSDCTIMVACGEFVASSCSNMSFGLYSSTPPSIDSCTNMSFACWNAAYPGLESHFQATGLPVETNLWNQVNDMSEGEGLQNYQVNDFAPADYWEVPLEGEGLVENPVGVPPPATFGGDDGFFGGDEMAGGGDPFDGAAEPMADGDMFGGSAPALSDDFAAATEPVAESFAMPAAREEENPKVTDMREKMRLRIREVDSRESEMKAKASVEAKEYLETLYKNRTNTTERRKKNNREEESLSHSAVASGGTYWERIIEYIDFSGAANTKKTAVDMSRYKSVLFAAKAKNVPVNVA
eukprot:CAMPEP_0117656232 /NCGR_PEP_ID=MMETSP0804-20121206/4696_1 /TAXON_ID=1074897 /ORGANISM="Tetraselmis astigmatica, Strain CCMP880" /LENGTH=359 /DNA_ID=CAMNT_0005462623 /DNA_START=112 /DNA_END=1191 /DNA_ORIENTATION=+